MERFTKFSSLIRIILTIGAVAVSCAAPYAEMSHSGLSYPGNAIVIPSSSDDSAVFMADYWSIENWSCPAMGACWRREDPVQGPAVRIDLDGDGRAEEIKEDGVELRLTNRSSDATVIVDVVPAVSVRPDPGLDGLLQQVVHVFETRENWQTSDRYASTLSSARVHDVRVTEQRSQAEKIPNWIVATMDIGSSSKTAPETAVRTAVVRVLIVRIPEFFFFSTDGNRVGPVPAILTVVLSSPPAGFSRSSADFSSFIGTISIRGRSIDLNDAQH